MTMIDLSKQLATIVGNSVSIVFLAGVVFFILKRLARVNEKQEMNVSNRYFAMEKATLLPENEASACTESRQGMPSERRRLVRSLSTTIVVSTFLYLAYHGRNPSYTSSSYGEFDWNKVEPSPQFHFVPCYDGFQCTRLDVPLDWNSTALDGGPRAAIAIIKQPARVDVTDPKYGGMILTNPGGPGGSGVWFQLVAANYLRAIIEPGRGANITERDLKYYDLVSFDPRGVGATTPAIRGLNDVISFETWIDQSRAIGRSMKDREIFNRNWARENVYGRYVSNAAKRTSSSTGQAIGGYVTTAIVVRDMVQIIEAHGLWRATRAEHLLRGRWDDEARKAKARTRWVPGEEVLNFYGMSYGTALGQEFATLQPHRIGRVVLDGVVDVQDYTDGGWTTNLNNADAITAKFAQHCIEAGDGCPISSWAGPGKDPVLLTSLIYSTITDLKEEPIASIFPEDESSIPEISTYSDAMLTLFLMWYRAAETFPVAASFLADIRARRAQSMWFYHSPISCPAAGHKMEDINAVSIAIRCTDAGSQTNTTKADFQSTLQTLQSQSPVFSDYWASLPMPCYGFELPEPDGQPIWRYPGPFGAKTANPILFASSALDPVTPLGNAEHAAEKLFPGAGLMVITDGAGHGSLSWPSTCAANAVSRYFATGDVGNGRIECKGDIDPFAPAGMKIMEGADMEVVAAIQGVKGALDRMGMGLGHSSDQSRMALRM